MNMLNTFLNNLNWRFATKKFNSKKKVNAKDLAQILEAIRLTPSSYGLQPYHVIVIIDQRLKDKIKKYAFLQSQVSDCSHLLIFCARTDIKKRLNDYIDLVSAGNKLKKLSLQKFKLMVMMQVGKLKTPEALTWSAKQTYLALGFAVAACAELKIDSCPMEGFLPKQVDKLLKFPKHFKSVVMLPIGYRAQDPLSHKFRYPKNDLFSLKK